MLLPLLLNNLLSDTEPPIVEESTGGGGILAKEKKRNERLNEIRRRIYLREDEEILGVIKTFMQCQR